MSVRSPSTGVIIAGSLTDFAKSLRELIGALRDLAEFIGDGGKVALGIYRRGQTSRAAQNLDTLSFAPQGSRKHLDADRRRCWYASRHRRHSRKPGGNGVRCEMSMQELQHYRDLLRKALGRNAAERLDNVTYGPFGKTQLRTLLAALVRCYEGKEPLPESAAADAGEILKSVEALNTEITALHDEIMGFRK